MGHEHYLNFFKGKKPQRKFQTLYLPIILNKSVFLLSTVINFLTHIIGTKN
jgi:hypothetical protein